MPTYAGRVEAKLTIPTGGAAISASNGALSSPVTVTIPAASYYMTSAGGVSSLLTTIKTQLDQNVQGYPTTAAAMATAVGYGAWSAGWLCNETSGSLVPAFGAPSLAPVSSPTYGTAGPRGGIDKAVGFDSSDDAFSGGDVHDVTATSDLVIAWVGKASSTPPAARDLFSKWQAANPRWLISDDAAGSLQFYLDDNVDNVQASASWSSYLGSWHVGIAVLDRSTNRARIGVQTLAGVQTVGTEVNASLIGTLENAGSFIVGDALTTRSPTHFNLAALYVGTGVGAATGMSANLSTALSNFANSINAAWSASLSTTTGRISLSNTFWPSSISFTSTALRDVLGFTTNMDYPQTAAEMATALGYGTWTSGAGYLCNESSGNLSAAFGAPATLTAAGTPTYSNLGPRGSNDKAVGFDSETDAFSGGDVFDSTATDDVAVVAVVRFDTVAGNTEILGKNYAPGWFIGRISSDLNVWFNDGAQEVVPTVAIAANTWYVVIAVLDRTRSVARLGVCNIATGAATVSSEANSSAVRSMANAGSFALGTSGAVFGVSGGHKIAAAYVVTGAGVASGLSANLSTALSNFATYMKSQTGTECAEGVFIPDCPVNLDSDPSQAPRVSDLRTTRGPTGVVLGLSGNSYRRHRNIVWSHVPRSQVWESAATYPNGSWEHWFETTQMGFGHSWFSPASAIQIWFDSAGVSTLVGGEYNDGAGVSGWNIIGLDAVEPRKAAGDWAGLWRIELPEIVSSG